MPNPSHPNSDMYGSGCRSYKTAIQRRSRAYEKEAVYEQAIHTRGSVEEAYADMAHPSAKYHEKSHGESFLALAQNTLCANGLYLFDEPEAALSPQRQLTLLQEIYRFANAGAPFLIVTHSPILLGIPNAEIFCFDDNGIHLCSYEKTESYRVTEMFINNKKRCWADSWKSDGKAQQT